MLPACLITAAARLHLLHSSVLTVCQVQTLSGSNFAKSRKGQGHLELSHAALPCTACSSCLVRAQTIFPAVYTVHENGRSFEASIEEAPFMHLTSIWLLARIERQPMHGLTGSLYFMMTIVGAYKCCPPAVRSLGGTHPVLHVRAA